MNKSETGLFIVIGLAAALLAGGAAGYTLIEGWPVFDSLYMTVITLATVGFSEIKPLTPAGRLFTMALILGGVVTIGIGVQVFVGYIIQKNIFGNIWRRRMEQKIAGLKNHVIVCGYGKIGHNVAEQLKEAGDRFVLVDRGLTEQEQAALRDRDVLFIAGEATDEEVLKRAGIERAATLVAVVGSDADNLFITMSAVGLNPKVRVIARAEDAANRKKLLRAGADKVVLPYEIGGRRIAALVKSPLIVEFLDTMMSSDNMELRLGEVEVASGAGISGRTLAEAEIRKRAGTVVLAVRSTAGALVTNPPADTKLNAGDILICLGTTKQIQSLQQLAGGKKGL